MSSVGKFLGVSGQPKTSDLISQQQNANNVSTSTPFGSLTFGIDKDGRSTANYAPSAAFSGVAPSLGNLIQGGLDNNFGLSQVRQNLNAGGVNAKGLRSGLTDLGDPNDLVSNLGNFGKIDTSQLNPMNTDFGAQSLQAQDATFQGGLNLLQPQLDRQRNQTLQRLADQGLPISGEAYSGELNRLDSAQGQTLNNLALSSILAGNNRQNDLFGQNLQTRQQGFGEQSTMADLLDRQRGQQFGENQGVFNAKSQNREQLFNENQAVFQNMLNKQFGLANLSNQNAQMGFQALQPYQANGAKIESADMALKNNAYKNESRAQALQSVGAIAGAFSDFRLKTNIEHIGSYNGYPYYEYEYKGKPGRYRGVMAQDVEKIMPEAVAEIEGYKAVRYDMIKVPFVRVN